MHFRVEDWDDAYANAPNIPNGHEWPDKWVMPAANYRFSLGDNFKESIAYADHERAVLDLFLPVGSPKGLVVFVHGGFWVRLDKSYWSHLAAGAVEKGWAVAMPSYPLCPGVRVRDIAGFVAQSIENCAKNLDGPIVLTGHSAGGHIVTRLVSEGSKLSKNTLTRVVHVLSISGVHDLRPLLRTELNQTIGLDEKEVLAESPVLLKPILDVPVTCWVGANERSEFVRQNALLANIWRGLGMQTLAIEEPDRHHFDVIDGLADATSPLMRCLLESDLRQVF